MRRVLRISGAAVAVALLATACSQPAAPTGAAAKPAEVVYHPDYPTYQSEKDLYAKATLVIEGKVTDRARTEKMVPVAPDDPADPKQNPEAGAPAGDNATPDPVVITIRTIEIKKVFKGTAKVGDTIEVKELGGQVDGVAYKEAEGTPLQRNATYALFLETYPDGPASLLNSQQGKYRATASGGYASMPGNPISLNPAKLDSLRSAG